MHFPKHMLVVGVVAWAASSWAQAPRLLPFQGKLTDSAGVAVPDGAKVIQFRLYDAPTAGEVVWPGEVHTVTVNGGLVNVLLGTQSPFADSFTFNRTVYLEITVDVNGDKIINAQDPAMQPRQLIVPVIFAQDAGKLEGSRWQEFFVDPNGGDPAAAPADSRAKDAAKLKDREWTDFFTTEDPATAKAKDADKLDGIDSAAIFVDPANTSAPKVKAAAVADSANGVNAASLVGKIQAAQIEPGAVGEQQVADGAVTPAKLAALPPDSASYRVFPPLAEGAFTIPNQPGAAGVLLTPSSPEYVPRDAGNRPLQVTIVASGRRPVYIGLTNGHIRLAGRDAYYGGIYIKIYRNDEPMEIYSGLVPNLAGGQWLPASMINTIDSPPAGSTTYRIQAAHSSNGNSDFLMSGVRLVAFEL